MSRSLVALFAVACGLCVANLYYCQPLLGALAHQFSLSEDQASLFVTLTQLGYVAGLLLLVPLGDLLENRKLVSTALLVTFCAAALAGVAPNALAFGVASVLLGAASAVAQLLVPFAAALAPPERRGQVVGEVMSGLLTGILLARGVAGIVSHSLGWRAVYLGAAGLMLGLMLVLRARLPQRHPHGSVSYGELIGSLGAIFLSQPVLRRRAFYQACMFCSMSAFWTCITFHLSARPYGFSEAGVGAFALVGALGALGAPLAGRGGDLGWGRPLTGLALLGAACCFGLTLQSGLVWLTVGAIGLDLAVQTTLILGQQAIYSLDPAQRNRLNTLYVTLLFLGGAVGSALGGWGYARAGWPGAVTLGAGGPLLAWIVWWTEPRGAAKLPDSLSDGRGPVKHRLEESPGSPGQDAG